MSFIIGVYEFEDPTVEEIEETIEELEEVIEECFEEGANDDADEYIGQLNELEEILEEMK